MKHTFEIEGRPKAKGRPRFSTTKSGRVITFTDQATKDYEDHVAGSYDGPKFEGPVCLSIVFSTTGTSVTIRDALDETGHPWETKLRGDIDNYIKSLTDGLNGWAYTDDKQVVMVIASKE